MIFFHSLRVQTKPVKLPVLACQYCSPHVEVLEYLHVGTGVLAGSDYRGTEPEEPIKRANRAFFAFSFASLGKYHYLCRAKP